MSEIREKMGNPMPFERVMGPNRHNKDNYGDLQPIVRNMKPTLSVPSENLSFGLLLYVNAFWQHKEKSRLMKGGIFTSQ